MIILVGGEHRAALGKPQSPPVLAALRARGGRDVPARWTLTPNGSASK